MDIKKLQLDIKNFAIDREWEQFHTVKNLIMALTGEVGELAEVFQWLTEEEIKNLNSETKEAAEQELADVFIYLLRLSDVLDIDPNLAIEKKLSINAEKYPIELSKGNAEKYNKRGDK